MNKIFLSLGTNLGDKEANLETALLLLSEKVDILKKSSYYETEPVGYNDQPWFLNMVIEGETELCAKDTLLLIKAIENKMKRIKIVLNGPRIIDIDILIFGNEKIETEELTIPHPRMLLRAFVMVPLFEIAPDIEISGRKIKDIIGNLEGEKICKRN